MSARQLRPSMLTSLLGEQFLNDSSVRSDLRDLMTIMERMKVKRRQLGGPVSVNGMSESDLDVILLQAARWTQFEDTH